MELVGRGVVARKKSLPGEGEQHMQRHRGGSECGGAWIRSIQYCWCVRCEGKHEG